ncbi:MAG: Ig domain-containing protein [Candidatus Korobacteraceae bacterium]
MRNLMRCCGLVLLALATVFPAHGQSSAAEKQPGVVITVSPASSAVAGRNFNLPLTATGGDAPYLWHLVDGQLPPGLKLHPHAGAISGVPATPGEYHFTIAVADFGAPPSQVQRAITITVIAGLSIDWKEHPKVQGNTLSGSVVVTNHTGQDFDLTVVVVGVNSIGRATTLGYQHFTLAGENTSPVIPFGSSPGPGSYVVHADAVAHHPGSHHIYRARRQTAETLAITQH